MRIFFVCRRVPFPPDRGDKIATFNVVRHLADNHEVHVFCLGDGAADLDNVAGLRTHAKSIAAVPIEASTIKLRALKALLVGEPLSVAAFNEARLHAAIRQKFDELPPDLIIVYSCNVAQFAEHFPDVPRVIQFGDLDSLKWQQYAAQSRRPLKWIYTIEQRRLLAYERHIARSFSAALVHTEAERQDFERLVPGVPVAIVGNGVDLDYFRSAGVPKRPASMVFTGVMDYRPNIDAVVWFCREILPIVRSEVLRGEYHHLRKPPRTGSSTAGKTSRRNGDRPRPGHAPLPRRGRGVRRAIANGARGTEQASRGACHGASVRRFVSGLERHRNPQRRRHSRGRPAA